MTTIGQEIRETRKRLGIKRSDILDILEKTCGDKPGTFANADRTIQRWENDDRIKRITAGGRPSLGSALLLMVLKMMEEQ